MSGDEDKSLLTMRGCVLQPKFPVDFKFLIHDAQSSMQTFQKMRFRSISYQAALATSPHPQLLDLVSSLVTE